MELSVAWDLLATGILRGGMYALMAVGLALVLGVMKLYHFAHGEFYMLGAYTAYFTHVGLGLDPIPALLAGALGGFAIGILTDKVLLQILRKRSKAEWLNNAYLITVGLSFILQNAALAIWTAKFRGITQYWEGAIPISPTMEVPADRMVAFLIAVVSIVTLWLLLRRTETGRAVRAVAQDERGAMLMGINRNGIYTLTFGISGMLAAIAGASLLSITPAHPTMGVQALNKSWLVVILVGFGNVGGSVVGGFIVGVLEAVSYYFLGGGWQDVVSLAAVVLILLFKPSGLFGTEMREA
jgi:branched-chain amino acid transport system permease protein